MLKCLQESLPSKRCEEIIATLKGKDVEAVVAAVKGDIAAWECKATSFVLEKPVEFLQNEGDLSLNSKAALLEAAKLEIFLSVLEEFRAGKRPINSSTISLTT